MRSALPRGPVDGGLIGGHYAMEDAGRGAGKAPGGCHHLEGHVHAVFLEAHKKWRGAAVACGLPRRFRWTTLSCMRLSLMAQAAHLRI